MKFSRGATEGSLASLFTNNCVSPINQLLCALRFYATGCFQSTAGDLSGVSKATAHRIVHRVSRAIASLHREFIRFPQSQEEIRTTQLEFFQRARFPKVVGAIDCTHIKFGQSPGGELPETLGTGRAFSHSMSRALFEQGVYGDAVLVGDSGYACKPYMMTPLDQCHTPAENLYNESQIRTRNPVERLFGVWKRRFPAMALGLRVRLENMLPIITATAVLHNIARRGGEELPIAFGVTLPAPWEEILSQDDIPALHERNVPHRRITRDNEARHRLINIYFERLAQQ
ncbi:hypothetical protein GE061_000221 [Apolygus lucorum]|uniref:DDE Tnp4 domain-containing protein n=1 Tax=Apolygus lucorum TaxID=248454 RepID=A0A8S9Y6B7_APOLU|nr:hypothetical protein GE061_000221 [Apolygus lucorum]